MYGIFLTLDVTFLGHFMDFFVIKFRALIIIFVKCYSSTITDLDFIVFAYWHRLNVVFAPQFFGQRCRHNPASDVRRSGEMQFTRLASGRRFENVEFHI